MIVEVFGVFKSSKERNSRKLSESVRKWESIHKVLSRWSIILYTTWILYSLPEGGLVRA